MGASRLQPVITRHTQVARINLERMRANVIEAAQQCGILTLPEVAEPVAFKTIAGGSDRRSSAGVLRRGRRGEGSGGGAARRAVGQALLPAEAARALPLAVLIGPEGGFAEDEREALHQAAERRAHLARATHPARRHRGRGRARAGAGGAGRLARHCPADRSPGIALPLVYADQPGARCGVAAGNRPATNAVRTQTQPTQSQERYAQQAIRGRYHSDRMTPVARNHNKLQHTMDKHQGPKPNTGPANSAADGHGSSCFGHSSAASQTLPDATPHASPIRTGNDAVPQTEVTSPRQPQSCVRIGLRREKAVIKSQPVARSSASCVRSVAFGSLLAWFCSALCA